MAEMATADLLSRLKLNASRSAAAGATLWEGAIGEGISKDRQAVYVLLITDNAPLADYSSTQALAECTYEPKSMQML